ncbi:MULTISPECIES: HpcH/HpaI aldolase/citrate lyase family protein [Lysinibacillus]|uniref:HpcH/HpaI aldolase/citrate lyase family protein n=1 Tax=Lysinibacillus TaxID=400634 RepID=UPI0006C9FA60|nr:MULTISPECIES: HpcH/HpaI aldolase/citrate lyase family protein [Lysinibacillus]MCT1541184.1 HpcH/HpaI aldolase/citrate lyase family protein [Lysinibacillus capsici]MCT1572322.1 HpcH/HpaI aldolase/citrate lyase family protein [Lysinibacillus capsici]MCT1649586.1 HpcH/HpaI aldolase/citrate lyase family protein [Lysinibacillus capsici]MCT1727966.1 HpcH/HpaI aldolase/citrate lyase family protein [Lysinibacillus capsici]MCT1785747.1 HpcH/HpaI aldolase/citrate lyase family protein [Lysinibacillus 
MQHFATEAEMIFYKKPQPFTKWEAADILSYALGATLYMPASMPTIVSLIRSQKYKELTSLVIDLEDAVGDAELVDCEAKLIEDISELYALYQQKQLLLQELPLLFVRVRHVEQFQRLTTVLGKKQEILTGYVFPKFTAEQGARYFELLEQTILENDLILYGMPILESREVLYKESRMEALLDIKAVLHQYKARVLNVRIGATDFCGIYGIRRRMDSTIYDISVIRDCIADIVNILGREEDGFIISGPVWEYFNNQRVLKPALRVTPFSEKGALDTRKALLDDCLDGLMKEVLMDKQNGIVGKTIIHPSHIRVVHALYAISYEEYLDALSIIENNDGQKGVMKSHYANKMNEIKPHMRWAQRILKQAHVYGVYHESVDFASLLLQSEIGGSVYATTNE